MKTNLFLIAFLAANSFAFSQQTTQHSKEEIKKSKQVEAPRPPEKDLSSYQYNPKHLNTVYIRRSELNAMPVEQQEKLKKAAVQYPHSVKITED
jgi:hypothetical protein